jgi:hypothetical protein
MEKIMNKIQEARLLLKKAGYKVQEGSFDPNRFEYNRGRQGDNNPNNSKPTGVKYSKTGNIHEGEGAKAFLEARQVLKKAGYKVIKEEKNSNILEAKKVLRKSGYKLVRECDEVDSEEQEVIEESKNSRKTILEARKTLARAGYKTIKENQDIDYKSNISVPAKTEEYPDSFPGTNTGDEEINQQGTPAASTEKGLVQEALKLLRKTGHKVIKESKKLKEFGNGAFDDEGSDDEFYEDESYEDEDGFYEENEFYDNMGNWDPIKKDDQFDEPKDLDFVDRLVSDAANFDEEDNLRGI